MIEQIVLIVHVLTALAIIGLILLQQGKGADMGASFGGGSSQTVFGAAGGGSVLTKSTTLLATLFFATSLGLAIFAKEKAVSAGMVDIPTPVVQEVPALDQGEDVPVIPGDDNAAVPSLDTGAEDAPAIPAGN